ncbi:hypothetical protein K8R42_04305 [bacterium]|nr:hypothetical protein [bacterium]
MNSHNLFTRFFGAGFFGKGSLRYWLIVIIIFFIIGFYYGIPFKKIALNITMFWFLSEPIFMGNSTLGGAMGFILVIAFVAFGYINREKFKKISEEMQKKNK